VRTRHSCRGSRERVLPSLRCRAGTSLRGADGLDACPCEPGRHRTGIHGTQKDVRGCATADAMSLTLFGPLWGLPGDSHVRWTAHRAVALANRTREIRDHSWGDVNEIADAEPSNSGASSVSARHEASCDMREKNWVDHVVPHALLLDCNTSSEATPHTDEHVAPPRC
jgi:hypothetical protein